MDRQKVFLVDEHPIARLGLRALFEAAPDFVVCGDASDAPQALERIEFARPDLVLTDVRLPGPSGLELTQQLVRIYPRLPVLVVSAQDEQLYAERAYRAGARGFVSQMCSEQHLLETARSACQGKLLFDVDLLDGDGQENASRRERAATDVLTDRELEIFLLIGDGFQPRHIAEQLNLSVSTVEVYRQRIRQKLRIGSSALLLRYAIQWSKERERSAARGIMPGG